MPKQYGFDLIRRSGLSLALAGLILTIAAPWLAAPATAQFIFGPMGMGIGMGMASPPVQQNAAPPPPPEQRSHKVASARRPSAANKRHATAESSAAEAPAKAPAKSNSSGGF
jgi:hypothetical protein